MTRLRAGTVALVVALAATAGAAPPPEAVKLFGQCISDFEAGKHEAARTCFRQVYALYKSPVVLFNLGKTEEALGSYVAAYAAYQGCLADTSGTLKAEEQTDVRQRLEAIAKNLTVLRFPPLPPGAVILVDGVRRRLTAGGDLPVLPGEHDVRVEAPRRRAWNSQVPAVAGTSEELTVELAVEGPASAPVKPAPSAPPPARMVLPEPTGAPPPEETPPSDVSAGRGLRVTGYVLAGLGVASLVVGTVTGVMASSRNDAALAHCGTVNTTVCDAEGLSLTDEAWALATVSTASFIAGGVAVGGGLVLYLLGRRARSQTVANLRVTPALGPGVATLSLQGGF